MYLLFYLISFFLQVCADHDRASGEGVAPQEYTIVKLVRAQVLTHLETTLCTPCHFFRPAPYTLFLTFC